MADVVFINPRTYWDIKNVTTRLPLAALYIGSVLKSRGYSMQLIDQRVDDHWVHALRASLRRRPLWVGISSMTGKQIRWGLAAAQIVREVDPTIPIVWGGVHPTILAEQTVNHLLVDMVVVGEGELTALELTQALSEKGPDADLSRIDGLVWKRDGKIIHNAPRSATDMNEWPPLDYSLVAIENYILSELPGERSLQITTSRGCPMRCGYCYLGVVPDGRCYRAEDPEKTIAHIERIRGEFNIDSIHIIDDEFFTQFKRVRTICRMLIDRGIRLTLRANCRVDYVNRMSLDDLRLIREAGFKHMYLGAESGNDRVLEFINKGITVAEILEANRRLKEVGISPKFSFIGGLPTETIDEVKDTLRLMVRLVRENPRAYCTPLQLYSPYPGTPLFDYCLQTGMAMPTTPEGWSEWATERVNYRWRSDADERLLGKIGFFSFFLDGKTIGESSFKWWMRYAAKVYGYVVRARVRTGFYRFMPEVRLIEREYHNSQQRRDKSRRNRYELEPLKLTEDEPAPTSAETAPKE